MPQTILPQGFRALELSPTLHTRLDQLGFVQPTPIQAEVIPHALKGLDVVGIAQTGTGKTLAFALPIQHRLEQSDGNALVLVPTRELALQVQQVFDQIGAATALLIGGAPMGRQIAQIRRGPRIIVATPGRLIDHLGQGTIKLRHVSVVVLDEADRMLDMGFAPAIRRILDEVPTKRQTMLFSATMPSEIAQIAAQYLADPIRIEIERPGTTSELIAQELYVVDHAEKGEALGKLLYDNCGTVLVFARTRHGARKVAKSVRLMGHTAAELHSDRTLAQRRAALDGFKTGEFRVLVATDIAARGIDVKDISLVINYDLPDNPEDYVHRIGRTGRAGSKGRAITLATPDQKRDLADIEKEIRAEIPLSPDSPLAKPRFHRPPAPRPKPVQTMNERKPKPAREAAVAAPASKAPAPRSHRPAKPQDKPFWRGSKRRSFGKRR